MEGEFSDDELLVDEKGGVKSRVGYALRPKKLDVYVQDKEVTFKFIYPISESENKCKAHIYDNVVLFISKVSERISKVSARADKPSSVKLIWDTVYAISKDANQYSDKSVIKNRYLIKKYLKDKMSKIVGDLDIILRG